VKPIYLCGYLNYKNIQLKSPFKVSFWGDLSKIEQLPKFYSEISRTEAIVAAPIRHALVSQITKYY